MGLLSVLIFLPLLAAAALFAIPERKTLAIQQGAFLAGLLTFIVSIGLLLKFELGSYGFQLIESQEWIKSLGIGYRVGVDGISLWLVLLTTLLSLIAIACSLKVGSRLRSFMACILVLESAMLGSFLSLDLVLFFVFFELTLLPMWLLVNIWGGEKRAHAANKFLIYTFAGSIFMLLGIISLGYLMFKTTGALSFDISKIQAQVAQGNLWTGALALEPIVFWAFAVAFLVKSPGFPFHTWIADTYAESPIAGVILSSVMVKMGAFGFLRFCLPLFPDTLKAQVPILVTLSVIGIVYGAAVAIVQPDMRRMMAYSSLSHMGFVLLGIFSLSRMGLTGSIYQQLNHGISATILFLLIGYIYQRRGSTMLTEFGGLKAQVPIFAALFLIAMLSSVGLPGTNGFVGEFLVILGAFQSGYAGSYSLGLVVFGAFGVVLTAGYLLYMFQRLFYGEITNPENKKIVDLSRGEIALAGVLVVFIFWGGLIPNTFLKPMKDSVSATVLMATQPAGKRPSWDNPDVPIEFYRLKGPTEDQAINAPVDRPSPASESKPQAALASTSPFREINPISLPKGGRG
jgi:NADH-quinone oxidoreductase subunit M